MTILNRRIPIFSYAHEVSKVIMMEEHVIIEEMHNKNPLTVFSVYTDIQSRIVRGLGQEILASLEVGITPEDGTGKGVVCSGEVIDRCYGQFWLWILGAYEVVRTMSQAEQCFSPRVVIELKGLKKRLAILRMPFAKQELRGKPIPVRTEPSIYGIGASRFAMMTGVSQTEAENIMRRYFATYRKLDAWLREAGQKALRERVSRTASGRMYRFRFDENDRGQIAGARRNAMNFPIQGTSADILKRALRLLHDSISGTSAKLVNIVHDEIIVECEANEAEQTAKILEKSMISAAEEIVTKVPIKVDAKIADEWVK